MMLNHIKTFAICILIVLITSVFFSSKSVLAQTSSPEEIDMLLVYTPAAEKLEGGKQQIETKLSELVYELNDSLLKSKNDTRFRLVKIEAVNYQEQILDDSLKTLQENLTTLIGQAEPNTGLARVQALKDESGADIVMLVGDLPSNSCGIAYSLTKNIFNEAPPSYFSTYAMGIYNTRCFTMAFIHEISHIMGNRHAGQAQNDAVTNEAYSFEFIEPGSNPPRDLVTITGGGRGGTRGMIPYFSNPELIYQGIKLGQYGVSCESCVVNLTRNYIAGISPRKTSLVIEWDLSSLQFNASRETATLTGTVTVPYSIVSIGTNNGSDWKDFTANGNKVTIQLEKSKVDTNFQYRVNNGTTLVQKIDLYQPEQNVQKTCSVSINKTTFNDTESLNVAVNGTSSKDSAEPVRLFLKKVDNTKIFHVPNGATLVENLTAKTNYYQFGDSVCVTGNDDSCRKTIDINALQEGSYQLHCDLPDEPNSCSGNPNCSYKGGPFGCEGWQACGAKDSVSFTVTKKVEEPTIQNPDYNKNGEVDIYDFSLLLQNYGKTDCSLNLVGECKLDSIDVTKLVSSYGK